MCHECRLPLSKVSSFSVSSGETTRDAFADDISPLSRRDLGSVFRWALRCWCRASLALELVKLGGRGIGGVEVFGLKPGRL